MARTREETQRAVAMSEVIRQMKREGVCTQKEFAQKCKIPETSLSELLQGKRPGTEKRWRLMAEVAGWEYDALLEFGEKLMKEQPSAPLYIVTQQNNRGVVTGVSNGAQPPQEEIAQDLAARIAEKLKGKTLEERIELWNRIKAVLEESE